MLREGLILHITNVGAMDSLRCGNATWQFTFGQSRYELIIHQSLGTLELLDALLAMIFQCFSIKATAPMKNQEILPVARFSLSIIPVRKCCQI